MDGTQGVAAVAESERGLAARVAAFETTAHELRLDVRSLRDKLDAAVMSLSRDIRDGEAAGGVRSQVRGWMLGLLAAFIASVVLGHIRLG